MGCRKKKKRKAVLWWLPMQKLSFHTKNTSGLTYLQLIDAVAGCCCCPHSSSHPGRSFRNGEFPQLPWSPVGHRALLRELCSSWGLELSLLTPWAICSWCFEEFARFLPDELKKTENVQGLWEGKWSLSRGRQMRVWRIRAVAAKKHPCMRVGEGEMWGFTCRQCRGGRSEGKFPWKNVFWRHGH